MATGTLRDIWGGGQSLYSLEATGQAPRQPVLATKDCCQACIKAQLTCHTPSSLFSPPYHVPLATHWVQ
jgi:hypothetical protein